MPRLHFADTPHVMLIPGPSPADRPPHRLSSEFVTNGVPRALVERHEDVAAEGELDIHGRFRRERVRVAVEMRIEHHALFGDLANPREAEDLKSTGIG